MTGNKIREKTWSSEKIRSEFLRFFEGKGHRRVRSSSLVPVNDPTLLFTNAGMNQFKDVFLGLEQRHYKRATSCQKCVRAGGKHNDLENVGFTNRHHTFFEMLGNFSFGDYFKQGAIYAAWELVTSPSWYGIDRERLYATVFGGAELVPGTTLGVDEEARRLWREQNIPADRIVPIPGLKENFWAMGDTGPCGPCSEIHYDMGPAASEQGHTDCKFPCDCGRYVEIWNLVFMQFNRDASGTLTPLPKPCVDTGMGLERVAAVLQGVISNYDTDLFVPLMKRAAELCGVDFEREKKLEEGKGGAASLRVIADHARAVTFLMSDGVLPSNEGRGYVLRKIIRRAVRHGRLLGATQPFLADMMRTVRSLMGGPFSAYPELLDVNKARLPEIVLSEEKRFAWTLATGLKMLDDDLDPKAIQVGERQLSEDLESAAKDQIELNKAIRSEAGTQFPRAVVQTPPPKYDGRKAFRLKETYGLPRDLIEDVLRDRGIGFDSLGYELAEEEERTRARASWKGGAKESASPAYAKLAATFRTEPDFYVGTNLKDARIEAIVLTGGAHRADAKNGLVNELKAGEEAEIVLDRTVIYAESGGQVADIGAFYDNSGSQQVAEVRGAYYPVAGLIAHRMLAKESLRVGDRVAVVADAERRARIMRNHSGTHLVNAALRNILGTHVKQAGSLNAPERLRFDFSHFAPVDAEELQDIEQQVNDEIRLNTQIETNVTSLEEALASGALAFFGDKYPEQNVRVVTIPDPRAARGFYSKELCGGTHVHGVGDIGVLKIVSEESVAAGVRRIEAVTGIGALEHYQQQAQILRQLAAQLNVGEDGVLAQVEKLSQSVKQLEKQLDEQKRKGALSKLDELVQQAKSVKGVKVIAAEVDDVSRDALRQLVDSLRQKLGSGVVVLATTQDGKVAIVTGVTKDLTSRVHAGKLAQTLAEKIGGKGGGRPDLAEAGGKDTSALKSAFQAILPYLDALL